MTETILLSSPAQGGMIEFDPSLPLQEELLDQSFDLTQVVDKRPRSTSVLTLGLAATPTNARPLRRTRGASVLRFSESEPWRRCGSVFFLAKTTPFLEIGNLRNLLSGKMKSTLKRLKSIDRQVAMSACSSIPRVFFMRTTLL